MFCCFSVDAESENSTVDLTESEQNSLSDQLKLQLINGRHDGPARVRSQRLPTDAFHSPSFNPSMDTVPNSSSNNNADHSRTLVAGLQRFSVNLLRSLHNFETREQSAGLLFSPFSVWGTMVVTLAGARGHSEQELLQALGLKGVPRANILLAYQGLRFWYELKYRSGGGLGSTSNQTQARWQRVRSQLLRPGLGGLSAANAKQLVEALTANNGSMSGNGLFATANRLFFNSNLRLSRTVRENFGDELHSLDFVNQPEISRLKINSWIEQQTHSKIKDLLAPGCINSFTNIVITNAIYFQQKWLNLFEKEKTIDGPFQVNPTEEMTVKYMRNTANYMFGVSETLKCSVLELPYSNQDFSMLIVLPDVQLGIDGLIKQLRSDAFDNLLATMYDDEIQVQLPRFKFEQEFELAGPLYSMGVRRMFDPRYSDFSGFLEGSETATNNSNNNQNNRRASNVTVSADDSLNDLHSDLSGRQGEQRVIINSVVHKAYIAVNEEGTEAAAASAMLIARSG